MVISKEEYLAWTAGIFEGEGSTNKSRPICVTQKDTWILYKLRELYGGSVLRQRSPYKDDYYLWSLYGESGRSLLKQLMPYLSPRRIKQIEDNEVFNIANRKLTCMNEHSWNEWNIGYDSKGNKYCRICRKIGNRRRNLLRLTNNAS